MFSSTKAILLSAIVLLVLMAITCPLNFLLKFSNVKNSTLIEHFSSSNSWLILFRINMVFHLIIPLTILIGLNGYLFYCFKTANAQCFIGKRLRTKYKMLNILCLTHLILFTLTSAPINIIGLMIFILLILILQFDY